MRQSIVLLAIAPTIAAAEPAPTSTTAPQIVALQQCRTVTDQAQRLVCYDKAVDTLLAATKAEDVLVIQRTEVRKARKGLFGFTLPRIDFLNGRGNRRDDQEDAKRLETSVVSARALRGGLWQFTVDGGGVWQTLETSFSLADPTPGASAIIERSALGAYFVKFGKGGQVQAKRIQ